MGTTITKMKMVLNIPSQEDRSKAIEERNQRLQNSREVLGQVNLGEKTRADVFEGEGGNAILLQSDKCPGCGQNYFGWDVFRNEYNCRMVYCVYLDQETSSVSELQKLKQTADIMDLVAGGRISRERLMKEDIYQVLKD